MTPTFEQRKERAIWKQDFNTYSMQFERENFDKAVGDAKKEYHQSVNEFKQNAKQVLSTRIAEAKRIFEEAIQNFDTENKVLAEDIKLYDLMMEVRDGRLALHHTDTNKDFKIQFVR